MTVAPTVDLDRVVLVDPSDFTTPYDLALAGAIHAEGRQVRLVGQAGALSVPQPLYYGHFYRFLTSRWGCELPSVGVKFVKGASHGVDMLRLIHWANGFNPGIVHFQWSPVPAIDRWIIRSLRRRVPVAITLHDSNPYQGAASWLMRQGYSGLLRSVDAIIVHTRQAQRRVAAAGIDPRLIYRIPHGLLGANDQAAAVPRRASRDRLVLLQFGKIKPYKGIDLLLQALTLVPPQLRDRLDVRIVGKPYMETAEMEQFVRENGLSRCVSFRFEFVSDAEAEKLFTDADAMLLSYREIDASGVASIAVARGLPVLATAIEGFEELFDEEDGARLVPPNDAAALSTVFIDWINAPQELEALATAMRLRRERYPGWDEIARIHLAVYAEAHARWLSGRRRGIRPVAIGQT
jgi:glycosyltransferase involved in cell wall biosynthesis